LAQERVLGEPDWPHVGANYAVSQLSLFLPLMNEADDDDDVDDKPLPLLFHTQPSGIAPRQPAVSLARRALSFFFFFVDACMMMTTELFSMIPHS